MSNIEYWAQRCDKLITDGTEKTKEFFHQQKDWECEKRNLNERIAKLEELLKERESRIDVLNGDLREAQEQLEAYKDYYEGEDVETECEDCPFPQHDEDEYQDLCIRLNEARATIRTLTRMIQ